MASLTPGVLLKLLQSMNSETKITGEHRSSILQVTGIIPAPCSDDNNHHHLLLRNPPNSFYLQLSDSLHSTYVSLDSSTADNLHLGQLVHVDKFLFASSSSCPLPRPNSIKPIPFSSSRSPTPSFSSANAPQPLIARIAPDGKSFLIQPASSDNQFPPAPIINSRTILASKENVVSAPLVDKKHRCTSHAGSKLTPREPSPAVKSVSRPSSPVPRAAAGSRSSSPVPSKCEVPSLVAAREENRRTAREPAIIVPSRYRQPSPVGSRRGAASPVGRRASGSPGRRLSAGMKMSPITGESVGRRKVLVTAGVPKISDALLGSAKSLRKSWEDQSTTTSASSEVKEKGGSKKKVDHHAIFKTKVAITRRLSDASADHSSSEESSNENSKQNKKSESSSISEKPKLTAQKVVVHDKKWTDGSIALDNVSDNLARLGKETIHRRNMASAAAAEALEEASSAEMVIRCLSMFSDLCSSSKLGNPLATIDRFLYIYEESLKCNSLAESLTMAKNVGGVSDALFIERRRSTSLWVEAALVTDLRVVSLLSSTEKPEVPYTNPPKASPSKSKRNNAKIIMSPTSNGCVKGSVISETLELANNLKSEMEKWFLKFIGEAVDVGFRLFEDKSDSIKEASASDKVEVAAVLSHLKRVNDWLDGVGRKQEDTSIVEIIERLKRKIYTFVISNVESAFDSSLSKA